MRFPDPQNLQHTSLPKAEFRLRTFCIGNAKFWLLLGMIAMTLVWVAGLVATVHFILF